MRIIVGLVTMTIGLSGCDQIEVFDSAPVAACTSYAKARALSGPSFKRVGIVEWGESITEEELDELRSENAMQRAGFPGLHLVGIQYEDLNPQGLPIDGLAQICAFETRDGELPSSTMIASRTRMAESSARMRDLVEMGAIQDIPDEIASKPSKYPCCL